MIGVGSGATAAWAGAGEAVLTQQESGNHDATPTRRGLGDDREMMVAENEWGEQTCAFVYSRRAVGLWLKVFITNTHALYFRILLTAPTKNESRLISWVSRM